MKKIVLTGIKPTGRLTLGNYIGVLKNLKNFQDEFEPYIFVADLHALTLPIEPEELNTNTKDIVAFYLASGLDMNKSHIFLQSMVSAHAELNAIMMNYLYMGELSRMTQFKQKSHLMNESAIGLGLFSYPVLMACDIILYDADIVPVGEDQVQHVELTRDLVRRFNSRYKTDILKEPKAVVNTTGKRIMSLSDPTKKMSKSDENPNGSIYLMDDPDTIMRKCKRAVTDSEACIAYREEQPGLKNLIDIYCACLGKTPDEAVKEYEGKSYGELKMAVGEAVVSVLKPLQDEVARLEKDKAYIDSIIKENAEKAQYFANKTLRKVQRKVGFPDRIR